MKKYCVKMASNGRAKVIRRYADIGGAVEAAHKLTRAGMVAWAGVAPVQSYRARLALTLGQRQRQRPPQYWPGK